MSHAALLKELKRMVELHGAAKIAVVLGYRDTRPLGVWLAAKKIPKARVELVRAKLREMLDLK